jgi:hypothetical protein
MPLSLAVQEHGLECETKVFWNQNEPKAARQVVSRPGASVAVAAALSVLEAHRHLRYLAYNLDFSRI